MYLSFIALALTLLSLLGAGSVFSKGDKGSQSGTIERMTLGFFYISMLAMMLNLLVPLKSLVFQAIVGCAIVIGLRVLWSERKSWRWTECLATGALFLACAVLSNRGWMHIDSGGYHNQMVKWLIESPIPFGLGNLHTRYAFNSIWHTFSASLSFPGLGISGSYASGSALAFVFIAFLRLRLSRNSLVTCPSRQAFIWSIFSGMTIVHAGRRVIETQLGSPSTDFPAAAFVLIFLTVFLDVESDLTKEEPLDFRRSLGLLAPLALAVTTKLSVAPIALVLLPVIRRLSRSALALTVSFGLLWIARTYILSGCLVYPMAASCFLPAHWSMPVSIVDGEYQSLHIWGRVTPPPADPAIIHSWFRWIPLWAKQAFTEELAIAWLRFCSLAGIVFFVGWVCSQSRQLNRPSTGLLWVGGSSFIALVFWFFQAPALRYGFGPIIASAAFVVALPVVMIPGFFTKIISPTWGQRWVTLCFCVFCFQALYNAKGIKPKHFQEAWPKFPAVETVPFTTLYGNIMSSPKKDGLCWNASLETRCTPTPDSRIAETRRWGRPEFYLR